MFVSFFQFPCSIKVYNQAEIVKIIVKKNILLKHILQLFVMVLTYMDKKSDVNATQIH